MIEALNDLIPRVIDKKVSINTALESAYHAGENKAYQQTLDSWQRALYNRIYNKWHPIDALVFTTQKLNAEHALMRGVMAKMREDFRAAQLELSLTGKIVTALDLTEYLKLLTEVQP